MLIVELKHMRIVFMTLLKTKDVRKINTLKTYNYDTNKTHNVLVVVVVVVMLSMGEGKASIPTS